MSETEWEKRYQTGDMPWEKGEPSPGLVDFLTAQPGMPRGTVAVPGCGTGHDVRAWAKAGFQAYGFDLAPIRRFDWPEKKLQPPNSRRSLARQTF